MNTLIQERNNHNQNCITVKVSRRTQNVESYLAKERFGLAIFSTDLEHFFGSNVGNDFGVILRRRGPQKPEFAFDIVRIHSIMIYTDLNEYNIFGDTKAPLLRCLPFMSQLMSGDIITSGQYMNNQTFNNLHFKPMLVVEVGADQVGGGWKTLCIKIGYSSREPRGSPRHVLR